MFDNLSSSQVVILFSALILAAIIIIYTLYSRNSKAINKLWREYRQAIERGDRSAALEAGRRYYSRMRHGRLTQYDEQAISNDLSTMK